MARKTDAQPTESVVVTSLAHMASILEAVTAPGYQGPKAIIDLTALTKELGATHMYAGWWKGDADIEPHLVLRGPPIGPGPEVTYDILWTEVNAANATFWLGHCHLTIAFRNIRRPLRRQGGRTVLTGVVTSSVNEQVDVDVLLDAA